VLHNADALDSLVRLAWPWTNPMSTLTVHIHQSKQDIFSTNHRQKISSVSTNQTGNIIHQAIFICLVSLADPTIHHHGAKAIGKASVIGSAPAFALMSASHAGALRTLRMARFLRDRNILIPIAT
jgi:hypothetical protein